MSRLGLRPAHHDRLQETRRGPVWKRASRSRRRTSHDRFSENVRCWARAKSGLWWMHQCLPGSRRRLRGRRHDATSMPVYPKADKTQCGAACTGPHHSKALSTVAGHLDAHVLCWRNNSQTENARGEERDSVRKPCAEEAEGGREKFVVR